jgi:hypothetical protein
MEIVRLDTLFISADFDRQISQMGHVEYSLGQQDSSELAEQGVILADDEGYRRTRQRQVAVAHRSATLGGLCPLGHSSLSVQMLV